MSTALSLLQPLLDLLAQTDGWTWLRVLVAAVSYTHLTLPTICSV